MKVGLCVTKHQTTSPIYSSLYYGTMACGDIPIIITHEKFLSRCDVVIGIGEANDGKERLRNKIVKCTVDNGIRRIAIDTGFILKQDTNRVRESNRKSNISSRKSPAQFDHLNEYFSFGYDGTKSFGSYYNHNSPSDRFEKLGIEIQPWVDRGDEILVIGINKKGFCSSFFNYEEWQKHILSYLVEHYGPEYIYYRLYRGESNFDELVSSFKVKQSRGYQKTLEEDFKKKFVTITSTSNCSVASLINGIPTICTHPINVLYPYVNNKVEEIANLKKPDRQQVLADLAYAQWNLNEIETGEAWHHLRPHINDPPTYNLNYMELAHKS